jgi:two-component system chemotaxis response regulator CheY
MLQILAVDDDELVRMDTIMQLTPVGRVKGAASGSEALGLVRRSLDEGRGFDVILMDVLMPGRSGLEAVSDLVTLFNERCVPLEKRPKIIMLSSVEERDTMIDALYACGADHYIAKPLDAQKFIAALDELHLAAPLSGAS